MDREIRSNFKVAVAELATLTGLRVFELMRDDGIPRPVNVGLHRLAYAAAAPGKRRAVSRMLWKLGYSKRYLAACTADGAMRHDQDGYPVSPVSPSHRDWARQRLEMREHQQERAAERRKAKELA